MSKTYNNPLLSEELVWANSAPQDTAVTAEIPIPPHAPEEGSLLVEVLNPSSVTALTVTFDVREDIGGVAKYFPLTDYLTAGTVLSRSCPASSNRAWPIKYGLLGWGLRVSVKNATVLGGSDAFTANLIVRSL